MSQFPESIFFIQISRVSSTKIEFQTANYHFHFFAEWTYSVTAVEGQLVELPCNASTSKPGDEVKLVLWFKNGSNKPIYTYVNLFNFLTKGCNSNSTFFKIKRKNSTFNFISNFSLLRWCELIWWERACSAPINDLLYVLISDMITETGAIVIGQTIAC